MRSATHSLLYARYLRGEWCYQNMLAITKVDSNVIIDQIPLLDIREIQKQTEEGGDASVKPGPKRLESWQSARVLPGKLRISPGCAPNCCRCCC